MMTVLVCLVDADVVTGNLWQHYEGKEVTKPPMKA